MRLSATSSRLSSSLSSPGVTPPPPQIVTSNLALHLDASNVNSFNPSDPNPTWNDISAPNSIKQGTLVSGAAYSPLHDGYIQFDGVDDHVQFAVNAAFRIKKLPFSVALFLRFNGYNGTMIDFRQGGGWEGFSDFNYNSNGTIIGTWSKDKGNYYTSNFRLNIGQWYHICYVRDGANFSCYLNGVLDKTVGNADWEAFSASLRLGMNIQGSAFHGGIGTVLYYRDKALTQSEVQQNHNACMPRFLT